MQGLHADRIDNHLVCCLVQLGFPLHENAFPPLKKGAAGNAPGSQETADFQMLSPWQDLSDQQAGLDGHPAWH